MISKNKITIKVLIWGKPGAVTWTREVENQFSPPPCPGSSLGLAG